MRRWCRRFEAEGEAGLADRRLGKASAKRVPADEAMRVARLYRERYDGFTAKHFHEHLVRDHGFRWGYTWTKAFLNGRRLVMPAPRRGAHRRKRPRRPMAGMILHQDASKHRWIPAPGGRLRPGHHPRRRDGRYLLGVPRRRRGHGVDLPGAA
jgi:hypothetical protein